MFINSIEENEVASDTECFNMRSKLIASGIITLGDEINMNRQRLIDDGILSEELYELIPGKRGVGYEEGEYIARPIKTEEEYNRRKAAYFRMIQEILYSRRDLKLILGRKEPTDPEWYF